MKSSLDTASEFKTKGNAFYKAKNYSKAIDCYESCLNICKEYE